MAAEDTKVAATFRIDDRAVVIGTDAYVSHRRGTPWRSSFSMSLADAKKLRDQISEILNDNSPL